MSSFWSDFEHKRYNLPSNFLQIKQIKVLPIGMLCRLSAAPSYLGQEILLVTIDITITAFSLVCVVCPCMYTYVSYIFTSESFFVVVYSGMLYILFALLLGAVCSRHALLTDYMIASKVSLVGVLFLFGLYISSLSSCLGAQYGAPRVLQCISKENVLPIIKPLGKGVRILGLQPRDKEAMLGDKKILTLFRESTWRR